MTFSRRTALRGMLNGAAIAVSLPLLDLWLDGNGEAMAATGAPLPVRFGCWFWGLGCNPTRWFPDTPGKNYQLKTELEPIRAHKEKINILGNFNIPLDGAPNLPHVSGGIGIRTGKAALAEGGLPAPSFDVLIGDRIGARSRFRSLDLSAAGDPRNSLSGRGNGSINPSETSPVAFYQRLFGTGFHDPNSAKFMPDPKVMARRSVLSSVAEQRKALDARVGSADRQRLDQYYTSLRQLENQLDVELSPPQPIEACVVPRSAPAEATTDAIIDHVIDNHKLMADLLVMALACDQTRVFNLNFNNGASSLTRIGSTITHHQLTHEEPLDNRLGYQPEATYFVNRIMEGWAYFVEALDKVKEGNRTLLDNSLVFAHSETEFAKFHTIDNIPMMTAGSGGGRVKTGQYIDGEGTPVTRVGLTLQQIMGVPVDRWGAGALESSKSVSELVA